MYTFSEMCNFSEMYNFCILMKTLALPYKNAQPYISWHVHFLDFAKNDSFWPELKMARNAKTNNSMECTISQCCWNCSFPIEKIENHIFSEMCNL